jgi:hypothetical protein
MKVQYMMSDRMLALVKTKQTNKQSNNNKRRGFLVRTNYTERSTAATGEVVPTFAGQRVLRGERNESPRPLISLMTSPFPTTYETSCNGFADLEEKQRNRSLRPLISIF